MLTHFHILPLLAGIRYREVSMACMCYVLLVQKGGDRFKMPVLLKQSFSKQPHLGASTEYSVFASG